MSFIERLKAQKTEELRRQQEQNRQERIIVQQSAASEEDERTRDRKRLEDAWSKSREYFMKSAFPKLCKELESIGVASEEDIWIEVERNHSLEIKSLIPVKKSNFYMALHIGKRHSDCDYAGVVEKKFVVMESDCEGTIFVYGGFFGSSTLRLEKWDGNPTVQEQALKKPMNIQ